MTIEILALLVFVCGVSVSFVATGNVSGFARLTAAIAGFVYTVLVLVRVL